MCFRFDVVAWNGRVDDTNWLWLCTSMGAARIRLQHGSASLRELAFSSRRTPQSSRRRERERASGESGRVSGYEKAERTH